MNTSITSHSPRSLPYDLYVEPEVKVAVIQYRGSNQLYKETRAHLLSILEDIAQEGAKVIVAPECACSDYLFKDHEDARQYSETRRGDLAHSLRALSTRYGCWCFVGVVELNELNELFNATFITSPEGELLCYRKRLLFEADVQWALSGDLYPTPHSERQSNFLLDRTHMELSEPDAPYLLLNIFGWRATLGICMDLNDARFLQFCEEAAVDLVIFPTNWIEEGHDVVQYWAHLLRDTRATLLAANSHGSEGETTFSGGSAILQATPPTLIGQAPLSGDYVITATLSYSSSREAPLGVSGERDHEPTA